MSSCITRPTNIFVLRLPRVISTYLLSTDIERYVIVSPLETKVMLVCGIYIFKTVLIPVKQR